MLFDLDVSTRSGWTVLSVTGELDVATAPRLRQRAVQALTGAAPRLVLDLTDVDFVDSTGLGVIVGVLKRVRGLEGELAVVVSEPRVRGVFDLTRVSEIVELFPTLEAALRIDEARPKEG